jgi:hypothetical protein
VSLFSCKDTTRLLSEALDHDLPAGKRLAARIHLLLCTPCTRFRRHLLFLRDAARRFDRADSHASVGLSAEARARILHRISQAGGSE